MEFISRSYNTADYLIDMTFKDGKHQTNKSIDLNMKLIPPDGGWGYVVAFAVTVIFMVTFMPMTIFGIVYGSFLAEIGDETSGTSMVNGIYNTVLYFTGLAANQMLQKMTYRKVAIIGSIINFAGAFGNIFVTSSLSLTISYGVIQGFGYGLIMPALYVALNNYFEKRRNLVLSVINIFVIGISALFPIIGHTFMKHFGFRGTTAVLSAISLNCIPAAICLQPAKWHTKKRYLSELELKSIEGTKVMQNLIQNDTSTLENHQKDLEFTDGADKLVELPPISVRRKNNSLWKSIAASLDLGLFQDPVYMNVAIGASLAITADLLFISMLPLLIDNAGFDANDRTSIITIFFTSDFVGRVILSVFVAFVDMKSRLLLLIGSLASAMFRIGFALSSSFWGIATFSALLGALRCLIQTVHPLVFAEVYKERFVTAFSLFMVVSGLVFLIVSPLIGFVKSVTQSNEIAAHVLTIAYLICAISWACELIYFKLKQNVLKVSQVELD